MRWTSITSSTPAYGLEVLAFVVLKQGDTVVSTRKLVGEYLKEPSGDTWSFAHSFDHFEGEWFVTHLAEIPADPPTSQWIARFSYPAVFVEESNGAYFVLFPDLNCATCGKSLPKAQFYAMECLKGILMTLQAENTAFPRPSAPTERLLQTTCKAAGANWKKAFWQTVQIALPIAPKKGEKL